MPQKLPFLGFFHHPIDLHFLLCYTEFTKGWEEEKMGSSKRKWCGAIAALLLCGMLFVGCEREGLEGDSLPEESESESVTDPVEIQPDANELAYEQALTLIEQGKAEEAYAILLTIKDYRDVSAHLDRFVYRYGQSVTYGKYNSTYMYNQVEICRYNQFGQLIERNKDGDIESKTYDAKGNMIREIFRNGDRWDYVYNDEKNLIRQDYYSAAYGKITESYTYSYDDQGNGTQMDVLDGQGALERRYVLEYDEKGNRTKETLYNAEGEMAYQMVFTYNEKGWISSERLSFDDGSWRLFEYEYNENGQVTREFRSNSYTDTVYEEKTTYDEHGNMTRYEYIGSYPYTYDYVNEYDAENCLIGKSMYSNGQLKKLEAYEYDEHGNVTLKSSHTYEDGSETAAYWSIVVYSDYQLYYDPVVPRDNLYDLIYGGK